MIKVAGLNWLIAILITASFLVAFNLSRIEEFVNDTCGWATTCKRFERL